MDRATFVVSELRTEYRLDPLGVDARTPRLSWQLNALQPSSRALRQTAWQILVASESSRLNPEAADLWNSGVVESDQTVHIEYAGARLLPMTRCCWTVRAKDQSGAWSPWSEVASWTMGLLHPAEWSAQWIGTGESLEKTDPPKACTNTLADPWLRRAFTIDVQPSRATAFIASVGFHELYVNGEKAGEAVLVPNVTDNSKRARYVAYEIASMLRPGRNVIGLWLGTGWSIFSKFATPDKPRAPIVLGQFDIDLPDGAQRRIVTDAEWKTHPSPSRLIGSWDFRDFGGEHYDARLEVPGWAEDGLDDSAWRAATVFTPEIAVSADCAESNRLVTEVSVVNVEPLGDGFRFDFGRNFSGWIELALKGRPGDVIEIQFSERSDRTMTYSLRSEYVIGPAGKGVFRNRFNYGVGRWITVTGLREPPTVRDLRGWLVRPAYAAATAFECSEPRLNEIFRTALWTFENLTLGGYVVDCPHRERMGYGGDAYATTATGLGAYRLGAFYTKWSEDWRDVQGRTPTWGLGIPAGEAGAGGTEEGNLPYTAPTYWGGGGPAWSGYCVHLPWEVYRRYGDEGILRENFATVERWLAFLETKAEGPLLGRYGGLWDFLGDWLWPDAHEVNGDTRETLFFNNCFWIYNLQLAAAIAGIVGEQDLRQAWTERAETVRRAVHEEFFNAGDASYVNGFQAYLAIALLVDVPPPELRPAVWKRLEHEILVVRKGHIHAGITGGAFLFQLLMEAGRDDLICAMVDRDDPPGWGAMLRQGATTFWEAWGDKVDSLLHSSFLYVGAWFGHGVLGIQPDDEVPGFARFHIRPGVIDRPNLTWAKGHYDSIRGRVSVAWQRTENRFELQVVIPPNTTAVAHLPTSDATSLREGGNELTREDGVLAVRAYATHTLIEVGSGHYAFSCPVASHGGERSRLRRSEISATPAVD